jgi:hypothetical protein
MFIELFKVHINNGTFGDHLLYIDCERFFQKVENRIKDRGTLDTILWIKDLRLMVYRFVSGNPLAGHMIRSTKDCLPYVLGHKINNLLRKRDPHAIRFVLSLFQVSRILEAWKVPSTESITTPGPDISPIIGKMKGTKKSI